jgi:hypothetical protein
MNGSLWSECYYFYYWTRQRMAIVVMLSHAPPLLHSPFNNSTTGHKGPCSFFLLQFFRMLLHFIYVSLYMWMQLKQEILTKEKKLHASFVGFLIIVIKYTFTIISVLESSKKITRRRRRSQDRIVFIFKRNSRSLLWLAEKRKKERSVFFFYSCII